MSERGTLVKEARGIEEYAMPLTMTYAIKQMDESHFSHERAQRFHEWFQTCLWRDWPHDERAIRSAWREWQRLLTQVRMAPWWVVPAGARRGDGWYEAPLVSIPRAVHEELAPKPQLPTHEDMVRLIATGIVAERRKIAAIKAAS